MKKTTGNFPLATPEQLNQLKSILENYISKVDEFCYEGDVKGHLSHFIYRPTNNLRDNDLYYFNQVGQALIEALAKRKVSEVIENELGEEHYDLLVMMLGRFIKLTAALDTNRIEAEMLLSDLVAGGEESKSLRGHIPFSHNVEFNIELYTSLAKQLPLIKRKELTAAYAVSIGSNLFNKH